MKVLIRAISIILFVIVNMMGFSVYEKISAQMQDSPFSAIHSLGILSMMICVVILLARK